MLLLQNITKYYGTFKALDNISFSVQKGKILGLLGPNGAGKTTTIRILTGILPMTSGEIILDNQPIDPRSCEWKSRFGVVPEVSNAFLDYSPLKNLIFSGRLYGLPAHLCKSKALELLTEFNLLEKKDIRTKKLSKGQKQKLNLCMALLHNPDFLFLDEPTTGLDVESAQLLRKWIIDLKNEGKTIFLTTHNMIEANRLCDELIIINKGKILASGNPEDLRKQFMPISTIELELKEVPSNLDFLAEFKTECSITTQNKKIFIYSTNPVEDFSRIQQRLALTENQIAQVKISPASLEEIFLKILGNC
ncbi:MAG: ABC transporter ATP-binding protein [Candidatus Helarchaeota archaeon]